MRRSSHRLLALLPLLLALAIVVAWPRPRESRVYTTYSVAALVALLQTHYDAVHGRVIAVHGYYHRACPSCSWAAAPALTGGAAWGGPSLLVALPGSMLPAGEAAWVTRWRALPIVGRLAPPRPAGPADGFTTVIGTIGPLCRQATICDAPPFVLHVLPTKP